MSSKAERGRALIEEALVGGAWRPTADVIAVLAAHGISDRVARRLAGDLGVERRRDGFPARGEWRLPPAPVGPPVARQSIAEIRDRLDERAHANTLGTRAALARVILAVVAAQEAGDAEALQAACAEGAAELVLLHDLADLAVAHQRRPGAPRTAQLPARTVRTPAAEGTGRLLPMQHREAA